MALPALVVGLAAIVAIAATGSTPGGSDETRPPSETLFDTLFSLGLVAVFLGGILLLYGLLQRRAIANEVASGKYRRTSLVTYLGFVALFTGFTYWRMRNWTVPGQEAEDNEFAFPAETPTPTTTTTESVPEPYEPSISWIPIGVVMGLLLAAIAAYVVSERRSNRGRRANASLAEQLAAVLDETLDDLHAEADPRTAIIAAYARLERVLGANGVPRRAAETSDEYLERVLRDLELEPRSIGRLTELFTRAKFSHHDVDVTMKEEAIAALEHVRDELRRARANPVETAPPTPVGATP